MHTAISICAIIFGMIAGLLPGISDQVSAQDDNVHMLELPILVAYCERDPGNSLQPGGGRFSPETIMADFNCDPAEGISVTVSNLDIDFFARCETGDDGLCEIEAPTDPERELDVAIHMSTVSPGYAPVEVVNPTVHFSEFTGAGIALLPDPEVMPGQFDELPERATLAVNVATCKDGTIPEGCEREAAIALVQASSGGITSEGAPWLATNDKGWVSFDRLSLEGDSINLMLQTPDEPRFACTDLDSRDRLDAEWVEGREGNFIRITPISGGSINCDVTLADHDASQAGQKHLLTLAG